MTSIRLAWLLIAAEVKLQSGGSSEHKVTTNPSFLACVPRTRIEGEPTCPAEGASSWDTRLTSQTILTVFRLATVGPF